MKRRVLITSPAESDALSNHAWWGENRSVEEANRWLEGIYAAMLALGTSADIHPIATEITLRIDGFRQAAFGLGRRPSHRILFKIIDDTVVVYRIRALKQDAIGVDDLTQ